MADKLLDEALFRELAGQARTSPRQRAHYNFHQSAEESVQRVLIALQPGSYVPAHRHPQSWKWEMLLVLRGELDCLIFAEDGEVLDRYSLTPEKTASGVELPAGCWHSIVVHKPDTILLEIKPGPYEPKEAAVLAEWCAAEGSALAGRCHEWMRSARIGDKPGT